ncbi:EthD family reductase [Massilia suwonensis]|uniref:EthD family reductase n=1 Tax=Massilia suwonensis TaxID=648895 RepID=A0ABW0MN70_9BURK
MIKVSVMYPNGPDARFDDAYYCERHMPMVKRLMGDTCKYYTVDRALSSGVPDSNTPYIAMAHLYCDSLDAFQAGFGPHTKEIMADIPNYTNQKPVIQVSEVLVDAP